MTSGISTDPAVLGGKPCIQGTRISVEFILELIASGASAEDIVKAWPQLTLEDVRRAVHFAAEYLRDGEHLELQISH